MIDNDARRIQQALLSADMSQDDGRALDRNDKIVLIGCALAWGALMVLGLFGAI